MGAPSVSYPGVTKFKEVKYTQTLGVEPDAVSMTIVPQASSIAAFGTLSIGYTGQTTITLPDCSIDSGRTTYNANGFTTSIILLDRRELWKKVVPINGRYNIIRNGTIQARNQKTLRELVQLLLVACGELTPDVSRVNNTIKPEVNWYCVEPTLALSALMTEWGYDVELGFDSSAVRVHEIGVGAALPTDYVMMSSSGVDATIQPKNLRVCFGRTLMQARLELEALALDTNDQYDTFANVSYKPAAGWGKIDPQLLTGLKTTLTAVEYAYAIASMYRVFRVKQFSDGDLIVPDGGGLTITNINQIFPLDNRRLDSVVLTAADTVRFKARVYGIAMLPEAATAQPPVITNTAIDDVLDVGFVIDGERGLVIFDDPMFQQDETDFLPAELYLETTFSVRDDTTMQQVGYHKDVLFDPAGVGYGTVRDETLQEEIIVAYTAGHVANPAGNTTNRTTLDSTSAAIATAAAGRYTATATQMVVYQYPRLELRLDGARLQLTHIISDGEDEPGSYTTASSGMEHDRFIRSRTDRTIKSHELIDVINKTKTATIGYRVKEAND